MFRPLLLCWVPAVLSIVVTDPPVAGDYKFSYDIEDPTTGDSKSQYEIRQGEVVRGAYSVLGPDGTTRIVEYRADPKNGFRAIVREQPNTHRTTTPQAEPELASPVSPQYNPKPSYSIPAAHTIIQEIVPIAHAQGNHDIILFTPNNEVQSDKIVFDHGKYFNPISK